MIVQLDSISKRYGRQAALRSVNLSGEAGTVVALLGANGAGKTTLLKIIATLTRQDRGKYFAFGRDGWERRRDVRSQLGYVGHRPFVYPELSCAENLRFFGKLFEVSDLERSISHSLDAVGLADRAERPASSLSRGLLQRLDLARATLHDPTLLVFDEPDTGLDVAGRAVLTGLMRERAERGCLVIFTSHAIEFAIAASSRMVTLVRGEVVVDEPSQGLRVLEVEQHIHGHQQATVKT